MVHSVPFSDVLEELRERKKYEFERAKINTTAKCNSCGHNLMAIGKSTIPGVCSICVSLSLIPDPK